MEWKQTPESARPSLRALARELGTSHQLLSFYLKGLGEWQGQQYWRQAREVRMRAMAEHRVLTQSEEQQVQAHNRAAIHATVSSILQDVVERLKVLAERGPLHPADFKILKILAKQRIPGAEELLQKCVQIGAKKKKCFAQIVKETPRHEGETSLAWAHRIWDECEKYDTKCPELLTEEILQEYSQGRVKKPNDNLPGVSVSDAKSFRRDQTESATPQNLGGGRTHAFVSVFNAKSHKS